MNSSDDKSKKIPKEWRLWAEENIKNGSDPNDLIKEMEKAGFSPSQVRPFVFSIEIDKNTIHQGKPVISGYKSIITKWFREKRN
tara:strand:- start:199 stop:450 length:252 start_codon:yes stop_codon:yes gene_type:complete